MAKKRSLTFLGYANFSFKKALEWLIETETDISFSQSEVGQLNDLVKVLKPVICGLEALCRRDSTLLTAEKITNFVLSQLPLF